MRNNLFSIFPTTLMAFLIFGLILSILPSNTVAKPPPNPVQCDMTSCTLTNGYGAWGDRQTCTSPSISYPTTEEELRSAVADANQNNLKVMLLPLVLLLNSYWENKHIQWYCCFVRNVLMIHQNPSFVKFYLSMEFDGAADDIKAWLMFALGRQAKEITLLYDDCEYAYCLSSILPKFNSQFLVKLDLSYCTFEGEFEVKLGSLQKLSLNHVRISNKSFQTFISGCPSLQELVVVNPVRVTKLSAPNIDKFSLFLTDRHFKDNSLSLNLHNLKILYLESQFCQLDIIDVSSVRDIYIDLFQVELPSPNITPQMKTIFRKACGKSLKSQFDLIESFLLSAAVLDKLVIIPIKCRLKEANELEFVRHVSSFSKASPSARVIFA